MGRPPARVPFAAEALVGRLLVTVRRWLWAHLDDRRHSRGSGRRVQGRAGRSVSGRHRHRSRRARRAGSAGPLRKASDKDWDPSFRGPNRQAQRRGKHGARCHG